MDVVLFIVPFMGSRMVATMSSPFRLVRRWRWTILALGLAVACRPGGVLSGRQPEDRNKAAWIEFRGVITPLSAAILQRKLDRARRQGAKLLVLEIDSPGGMLGPTLQLAETIRDIDWAKTIAFVPRQALSGAAIMSLGCDQIILTPRAHIGDAGPVVQGDDALFRHAPEKLVSELARVVRDLAESTGKPPAIAEAMVNRTLQLYVMRHRATGKTLVMSREDLAGREDADQWEEGVFVPESAPDKFLTLNGNRALELGLADAIVADHQALWKELRFASPPRKIPQSAVDVFVIFLNSPLVTGALLIIGIVALVVELGAPGIGFGALLSGLCFSLFFWSRFLSDTAGWLEVILFAAGVVFLAMEIFVLPGFGIAGICGIGLLMASIVMASYQGYFPQDRQAFVAAGKMTVVFLGSIAGGTILLAALASRVRQIPFFKHLVLAPPEPPPTRLDRSNDGNVAASEEEAPVAVGDEGVADSPLRPAGRARFGERYIDVMADSVFVDPGTPIRVVRISGGKIIVRPSAGG